MDQVHIGYVVGDCALSVVPELRQLAKALWRMRDDHTVKQPALVFPLRRLQKSEICNLLPAKLKDLIWFCEESNTNRPCGTCDCCTRHKRECGWGFDEVEDDFGLKPRVKMTEDPTALTDDHSTQVSEPQT